MSKGISKQQTRILEMLGEALKSPLGELSAEGIAKKLYPNMVKIPMKDRELLAKVGLPATNSSYPEYWKHIYSVRRALLNLYKRKLVSRRKVGRRTYFYMLSIDKTIYEKKMAAALKEYEQKHNPSI